MKPEYMFMFTAVIQLVSLAAFLGGMKVMVANNQKVTEQLAERLTDHEHEDRRNRDEDRKDVGLLKDRMMRRETFCETVHKGKANAV